MGTPESRFKVKQLKTYKQTLIEAGLDRTTPLGIKRNITPNRANLNSGTTQPFRSVVLQDLSKQQIDGNMHLGSRLPQVSTLMANGKILDDRSLIQMQRIAMKTKLGQVQPTISKAEFKQRSCDLNRLKKLRRNQSNAQRQLQKLSQEQKMVKLLYKSLGPGLVVPLRSQSNPNCKEDSGKPPTGITQFGFGQHQFTRVSSLPILPKKPIKLLASCDSLP